MNTFTYELNTKTYFGKNAAKEYLPFELEKAGPIVMLTYGGGSIKRNGIYDEQKNILEKAEKM